MATIIRTYRTARNITGAVLEAEDGTRFARFLGAGLSDEAAANKIAELFGTAPVVDLDTVVDRVEAAGIRVWRGGDHARVYAGRRGGYYDLRTITNEINSGEYDSAHSGCVGKPRAREREMICAALFGKDRLVARGKRPRLA